MKQAIKKGLSFGLTTGIITTIGLIVGLGSSSSPRNIIVSGILIIALADAMSDAMGIHISEEAEHHHTEKEIWASTGATFFSKFLTTSTFLIPVLLLPKDTAVLVSIVWGLSLITIFSLYLAHRQKVKPYLIVTEHFVITSLVITATYYIGHWLSV